MKDWRPESWRDHKALHQPDYPDQQALDFMEACGLPLDAFLSLQGTALYTSHEALLLECEEAMVRQVNGLWYDLSAYCIADSLRKFRVDKQKSAKNSL